MIERWLKTPSFKKELESLSGDVTADKIRKETKSYIHRLTLLSQKCFGEFSQLFDIQKKYQQLPSR